MSDTGMLFVIRRAMRTPTGKQCPSAVIPRKNKASKKRRRRRRPRRSLRGRRASREYQAGKAQRVGGNGATIATIVERRVTARTAPDAFRGGVHLLTWIPLGRPRPSTEYTHLPASLVAPRPARGSTKAIPVAEQDCVDGAEVLFASYLRSHPQVIQGVGQLAPLARRRGTSVAWWDTIPPPSQ